MDWGSAPRQRPKCRPTGRRSCRRQLPAPLAQPQRPTAAYRALDATDDAYDYQDEAYRIAEQQRVEAIQRQTQLAQAAATYRAWSYAPSAAPYVLSASPVYTYLPPRVYRRAYRRGYVAVPQPVPYPAVAVHAYPYTVLPPQPTIYGQVLVAPGVGVYRPTEAWPVEPSIEPSPGRQPTPAAPRTERPSGPLLMEPGTALPGTVLPEMVPPPPAEPAPYLP